jgi:hypothetical protein
MTQLAEPFNEIPGILAEVPPVKLPVTFSVPAKAAFIVKLALTPPV